MPLTEKGQDILDRRLTEVIREIGTLLLAFAPLDYFQQEHVDALTLVGLFVVGIALVALAIVRETRGAR